MALRYNQPEKINLSPESFTKSIVHVESSGYCDVSIMLPLVNRKFEFGIYVIEHEWLISVLFWMRNLPGEFLELVENEHLPEQFDVVIFGAQGMYVWHVLNFIILKKQKMVFNLLSYETNIR